MKHIQNKVSLLNFWDLIFYEKKDPPMDHEKYKDEQNKFEKYFKENV